MHTIKISTKELLMIDAAMTMLTIAVSQTKDTWTKDDMQDLLKLRSELRVIADLERKHQKELNAENTDRR